jgi:hypothetical protein
LALPRSRGGNREWRCHDGRENVRIVGFGLLVSVGIPRYGLKDSIGRYTMQTFVIERARKKIRLSLRMWLHGRKKK